MSEETSNGKVKKSKNRRILIIFGGCLFFCVACAVCSIVSFIIGADDVTIEGEVTTAKGTFSIPGTAYMDGRDLESTPRITIMNITVWASAGRRLAKDCTLSHGERVELLSASQSRSEGRYYLEVRGQTCEGWVSEPFVSPIYHSPEGQRVQ